ncbi:hypothetical protein E3T43_03455 [Cryobacterium sp. Hh7]|uniref:hypothetical protein n=1 Tax=Cryobacterium sp. Hh7 TaxID=1259159 RepID=UPI0010699D10|nr:hypothetical protein [Cryobacterium sp. Hh7]TFD59661.1 hypothetical protein E3T43_03455 [Cryobacterium sp. Hh7]
MSETIIGRATVDTALAGFRDMLATDGYLLSWEETKPQLVVVRIAAGEDACADCLVPQPVMEAIMTQALAGTDYTLDHVVLPGAH